jgi:hypothetical protein
LAETTITIDKFLGLNMDSTEGLNIQVGELSVLQNIRITENYKMRKREGYTQVINRNVTSTGIMGLWYGKLSNTYRFVFARDGKVYEGNLTTGATTDLGSLTNARTYFFAFNDKLYIQNGYEYKYWTGTGSIADVVGYVPLVFVSTPPSGGGTRLQFENLLTGKKHQTFNGDNTSATYRLNEQSINSVDSVYVSGVLKTVTTHYTVDLTNGTITFTSGNIPSTGIDNVDIYWTKGNGTRSTVTANKQSVLFGGANDSRIFMYGQNNKIIFSGLISGVPNAEYFPINNFKLIGSDEYAITHISKQYDRLIIHKERDSYYMVIEIDINTGASFLAYPLNDSVGNIAFGEGKNILNNPFVITNNGVFQFNATNVRDEKNAVFTSQRVQNGLDALTLSNAITLDWEKKYEYWVCVGNQAYVYNYKLDVWYYFQFADTPSCFIEIDGVCYFGTSTGKIMKFDQTKLNDNGTLISARFETGFMSFDANYVRKFLNFAWVGLQPQGKSKAVLSWETDNNKSSDAYPIEYNLIDFGNISFSDFSFQVSDSPKPYRLKFKCKKFTYLKIIGENNETTKDMVIQNITMPVVFGGMSK